MNKLFLTTICIFLLCICKARTFNTNNDSSKTKFVTFHLGISLKPLANWISRIDSNGSFLNSSVYFEPQLSYKKSTFLVGITYINRIEKYKVNEIPAELQSLFYLINPTYYYNLYSHNRWKIMPGISVGYTKLFKEDKLATSLELISEKTTTTNKIVSPLLRMNYKLNKIFSIEAEFSYSLIWLDYNYIKDYPLTPSLARKSNYTYFSTKTGLPSNILFKISF